MGSHSLGGTCPSRSALGGADPRVPGPSRRLLRHVCPPALLSRPPLPQVKGDITINMPQQQVQYRKKLPLSGGAVLVVDASCRLEGGSANVLLSCPKGDPGGHPTVG